MQPAARVAAAIDVLARWRNGAGGLDRVLASWGREHRFAGSGDRRAIADLAYCAVRRWRSAAWTAGMEEGPRAAVIGTILLDGAEPADFFTGARHAPAPLAPGERCRRDLAEAPRGVRLDLPDWLLTELCGVPEEALLRLRHRAPLDLRVNFLRSDVPAALRHLAAEGIDASPGPLSPSCLRVAAGASRVQGSTAFGSGLVEVQDAASQAVADFAGATPGETVLDFCAGGGGKTLAMAATMRGAGRLIAHDASSARLRPLEDRARRAGATVQIASPGAWRSLAAAADLALVDAPCSGSGAWRRNPDAKWRLDRAGLDRLLALQAEVLDSAATTVRPGGRLVYATCSLLARENEGSVRHFLERNRAFRREGRPLALTPIDGGDGFYAALFRRDAEAAPM